MPQQTFINTQEQAWIDFTQVPGTQLLLLAEPVPQGSIHLATLTAGTTIPIHTHPCDEYVYVLTGIVETGGVRCEAGTFWFTSANVRQGPHHALTDTKLLTIRLGAIGTFEPE